jgi:signal transduction histidine kinase/ligand-binding sensor domain-containing protein/cell division protein FtsL
MIRKMLLVAFYVLVISLNSLEFEHIGNENDFGSSIINDIYIDKIGYLWISSNDGLYRYDGVKVNSWKYSNDDKFSISSNFINGVVEDGNNDICIATMQGLSILNRDTNKITRYFDRPGNPYTIKDTYISSLYSCNDGNLFVSTYQDGMFIYYPKTKKFKRYPLNTNISVYEYHKNADGALIISTSRGFLKFDPKIGKFVDFPKNSIYEKFKNDKVLTFIITRDYVWISTNNILYRINLGNNHIQKIKLEKNKAQPKIFSMVDFHNKLLIGTNYGLYIYNKINGKIKKYINDTKVQSSLSDNFVSKIVVDNNDNIFIATDRGVDKLNFSQRKIHKMINIGSGKEKTDIVSIYNDSKNNLWIGKYGSGVFLWERERYKKAHFIKFNTNNSDLPDDFIYCFIEDNKNKLWIATDKGLGYYDYRKSKIFAVKTGNKVFDNAEIFSMCYTSNDKNIWCGTISSGLFSYNIGSGKISNYISNDTLSASVKYQSILDLTVDNNNRIWLTTNGKGLVYFDRKSHKFTEYNRIINGNYVDDVVFSELSPDGSIWIGTFYSGVVVFDPDIKTFSPLSKSKILEKNTIFGIVFDNNGEAWISVKNNLYKYNMQRGITKKFTKCDGLLKELNAYSFDKDRRGCVYFGGREGINWFYPDSIKYNEYHPPVSISNVKIDSTEMIINSYNYPKIEVTTKQHKISIGFSVLDYMNPIENVAYYRLIGYDKDWIKSDKSFIARYDNLPGGDYIFEVKAFNNDGSKSRNIAKLNISVLTPFTKSFLFIVIIATLLILLLIFVVKFRTYKLSKKKEELEKLVALRTDQLKEKADQLTKTNKIIKMVNFQTSFDAQLSQIKEESKIFPNLKYLDIYVLDSTRNIYFVKKSISEYEDIVSLDEKDYIDFKKNASSISDHIWLDSDFSEMSFIHTLYREVSNLLLLEFEVENRIVGFIIFGMNYSILEYHQNTLKLLEDLSLHFGAVFQRGILVEKLKEINEKKNEIIGIAAHDLRNPLASIISATEMINFHLKKQNLNLDFIQKNIDVTLTSALRMDKLIKDLLSTSEIESGKVKLDKKLYDLGTIFEESLNSFIKKAKEKKISIEIDKIELPKVWLDKSKILQLADNLISNALKYTFPGGKISISFEIVGKFVHVNVKDTGQGLSDEDLKHVFKSFKKLSAKPTGGESSTGLGLAIAERIVNMHQGKIWVNSKKGEGATFSFAIPTEIEKTKSD